MALVRLILVCLRFEIQRSDIADLRQGFADWVVEYERLYYRYDPQRYATCTINIHALLHIADMIESCGPVWCYWAYVMERYCNSLLQAVKSRRFPFASLDKRVRDIAQLTQIKVMYNLHEKLDLSARKTLEKTGISFPQYPHHIALISRHVRITPHIRKRISEHLSDRFSISTTVATDLFPSDLRAYGKVQRLEGGDMMHASEFIPLNAHSRDMSWVKYAQYADLYARFRNRTAVLVQQDCYGQILQFLRIPILPNPDIIKLKDGADLLLATIRTCITTPPDAIGMRYFKDMGAVHVADVGWIEGLIGRVWDRDRWAIAEREGIFRRIQLIDEEEQDNEATAALIE